MDLDGQVAGLLAQGSVDAAATAALQGLGPAVLGYLRSILAEDEAQDAFSRFSEDLWRGLPAFRGESSLRTWAFKVAWHAANRLLRDPWRRRGERLPSSAASRLADSIIAQRPLTGRREALELLKGTLTEEERTLLALRVHQELEFAEVAAVLSTEEAPVNAAAVRKRFERLKDRLAAEAQRRGMLP